MSKENYEYTNEDFEVLREALKKSDIISYGRPDQFQYYQNELSKAVASFILKPYLESLKEQNADEECS